MIGSVSSAARSIRPTSATSWPRSTCVTSWRSTGCCSWWPTSPGRSRHRAVTPAEDRLAMVAAAVAEQDGLEASDLEIKRGGPSYTADTLEELAGADPGASLHVVLGRMPAGLAHLGAGRRRAAVVRHRGRPRSARGPCRAARRGGWPGVSPAARGVEHRPPGPAGGRAPGRLPGPRRGRRVPARASPLSFTPMTTPRGRTDLLDPVGGGAKLGSATVFAEGPTRDGGDLPPWKSRPSSPRWWSW